ncbi:ABC transporter permease [Paenibacillus daejeonensis]|uniref:ABC transporter permease n=1 Tax=Paenibacillus daejeonensis TaxID=135193 RepID=UPI000375BE9F|nr:ABC transporter permease [Paenibacillus daejeonensis]
MTRQQFRTLLYKEMHDLRSNGQALVLLFIPFSGLASLFFQDRSPSWSFLIIFTLMFLPLFMMGFLLVQEKEQRTWRLLHQQGYKLTSLLSVKALLACVITLASCFVIAWLGGVSLFFSILVVLYSIPCVLMMLSLGALLGALSKNTIEVSFWGTPIIIIFIALEIINRLLSNHEWSFLMKLLPNHVFAEGLENIVEAPGAAFVYPFFYFIFLAGVFALLALYMLRKRAYTF